MTPPNSAPDERIEHFLRECEAVGFDSDPIPKLVRISRDLLAQHRALEADKERLMNEHNSSAFRLGRAEEEIARLTAQLERLRADVCSVAEQVSADGIHGTMWIEDRLFALAQATTEKGEG